MGLTKYDTPAAKKIKPLSYLKPAELLAYLACLSIGAILLILFIISGVKTLVSGKGGLGGLDFLFICAALLPFLIALRISDKGVKRALRVRAIAEGGQKELLEVREKLQAELSKTIKRVFLIGCSFLVLGLAFLIGRYYLLSKGEYIRPLNPCNPPRQPKVLFVQPSKGLPAKPDTTIKIFFNENMDTQTLNSQTIKVCTRLVGPLQERERVICKDIQDGEVNLKYDYSPKDMKLSITLPQGKVWGGSDTLYKTYVEISVSKRVKSSCGLPLVEGFSTNFLVASDENSFIIPPSCDEATNSSDLIKEGDLTVNKVSIAKEFDKYGEWYVAKGVVKNNSQYTVQPVYVEIAYFDDSGKPFSTDRTMINNLYCGAIKPAEEIPFEERTSATKPYVSYEISAFIMRNGKKLP